MGRTKERIYSGRVITEEDISMIRWIIDSYRGLSRYEMINTIVELVWIEPIDGRKKAKQCIECLNALESEGLIELPVTKKVLRTPMGYLEVLPEYEDITESSSIELVQPSGTKANKLWRSYIKEYHPLGHMREYGKGMRYFIMSEGTELGCIQFSASAWSLEDRDQWIGWDKETRIENLRLVVNNSRYLLLPWAKIPYLASRVLGKVVKQIQTDWLNAYGYAPALLETFVDSSMYKGTCYKASNWIQVGETKGRGRNDINNEYNLTKKLIFVYPLQKDYKEVLLGEKPYRRMDI